MNLGLENPAGAARRNTPRPSESLPSSPSTRGDAAAAPPSFQPWHDTITALERGCGKAQPQQLGPDQRKSQIFPDKLSHVGSAAGRGRHSRAPKSSPCPQADSANAPSPFHCFGEQRAWWTLRGRWNRRKLVRNKQRSGRSLALLGNPWFQFGNVCLGRMTG